MAAMRIDLGLGGQEWAVFILGFVVFVLSMVLGLIATRKRRPQEPEAPDARLKDAEGQAHELKRGSTRIGRDPENDIVIPQPTVSARHASIETRGGGYSLQDLGSGNGTFLNGRRLGRESAALTDGDRVRFDAYEFAFETGARAERTEVRAADAEARTLVKPQREVDPAEAPTRVKPDRNNR